MKVKVEAEAKVKKKKNTAAHYVSHQNLIKLVHVQFLQKTENKNQAAQDVKIVVVKDVENHNHKIIKII